MLNGRTYIGILLEQQRQSATIFVWTSFLKRTHRVYYPVYCLMALSQTSLAWKLRRNSMNFETVGRVASPLALRLAARLRDFLPSRSSNCRAVLSCRSPRRLTFSVIMDNLLTEL
ncbi:unnamed protein product [Lasius platythorax]|uniref:Uncharacterized protein n=1 Tax=Lasius platythorax TaxID=488582 RepID=A0AAV2P8F1_9HYME